jgi:hypothetical protein
MHLAEKLAKVTALMDKLSRDLASHELSSEGEY